jgi:hypothetical protein
MPEAVPGRRPFNPADNLPPPPSRQLEMDLYGAGYRETRRPVGHDRLRLRRPRSSALQQYVAMLDAAQLVRRMATTRTNRSILTRMKREAVTIALHLPDEQAFEGVVARGLDYRPLGPQTGTIPEPPRFQLF